MTTADDRISRIEAARAAEVEPPAVNNWGRRHADFPAPSYTAGQDLYSVSALATWLDSRRIPRNALHSKEPLGTTYGQRFRKNLDLPPPTPTERVPQHSVMQTDDALAKNFWDPLEKIWGTVDFGTNLELVLSLLDLRRSDTIHWKQLTSTKGRIGDFLGKALPRQVERSPGLSGVYAGIRQERWPDEDLTQLITIIERAATRESPDTITGDTFEAAACRFLLEKVAAAHGRRGKEYFTPPPATRVIMELIDPQPGERICDPCCGTGELLVAAGIHARQADRATPDPQLRGYALDHQSWRLATLNAAIHGLTVDLGGHPIKPLWLRHSPAVHDVVVMNPPFNTSGWSDGDPAEQPYWEYGPPPGHNANFAWLQYAISILDDGGRAAVVMPTIAATIDRAGEGAIRAAMITRGVVRCIIALPDRLFRETSIPVALWILGRPTNSQHDVLFIDAHRTGVLVDRTHRVLADADHAQITRAYQDWLRSPPGTYTGVADFAATATPSQIRDHGYQLNPATYLTTDPPANDLHDTTATLRALQQELDYQHEQAAYADNAVARHLRWINL